MSDPTQTPPPPPFPADPGYTEGGMLIAEDDEQTPLPEQSSPPAAPPAPAAANPGPFADENTLRRVLRLDAAGTTMAVPPWVRVPNGLRYPRGRKVRFMRIPARWTDTPNYGHSMPDLPGLWRQWIMWSLSPGDEQIAAERTVNVNSTHQRYADELVKQSIRAIDGHVIDQTGRLVPHNVEQFWAQMGAQGRNHLKRFWAALNTLDIEQQTFFLHCCFADIVAS